MGRLSIGDQTPMDVRDVLGLLAALLLILARIIVVIQIVHPKKRHDQKNE